MKIFKVLKINSKKYAENDNAIKENPEISVDYYGLILCYIYNYDFSKFSELVKHIYAQDSNILFQILLTYKSYLKKDIKIEEKILEEFIKFTAGKTYKDLVEGGLIYLKNLKLFLNIINKNKEKLISIENFKPLPIKNTSGIKPYELLEKIKEHPTIKPLIKDIMEFSQENNKILIYFNDTFWKKLISICNTSSRDNINNLSELRELFNKYFELVTNTIKKGSLFDNAQELYKKDEFDIKLDKNIIEHIKHEKDISNIDIITFIMKEDPIYYTDKNKNKRDIIILDQIDFDNIDDEFIEAYKSFSFETIFKNKIVDFLKKLFDKVKNWKNFCNIYQLINDENIDKSKIKDLINLIFDTYDKLIKSQKNLISNLSEIELQKLIETLSDIAVFTYDNNINFFNKIEKLDEEIRDKIYIELYSKYNDEKHKEDIINKQVKKYYIKNLESGNMDRFISFIEKLNFYDNYKDIMDQINNTYKISENDFYATKENKNIILLCKLNDKKLIMKEDNIYFESCKPILESIYSEIDDTEDGKKIKFSQLKSLFNRKEENYIIEKFKLFTLIKENLDDNSVYLDDNSLYKKLKGIYKKINKALHDLKFISINFQKYFGKIYEKDIEKIKEYVKGLKEINELIENKEDVLGCVLSGAGPTILIISNADIPNTCISFAIFSLNMLTNG